MHRYGILFVGSAVVQKDSPAASLPMMLGVRHIESWLHHKMIIIGILWLTNMMFCPV